MVQSETPSLESWTTRPETWATMRQLVVECSNAIRQLAEAARPVVEAMAAFSNILPPEFGEVVWEIKDEPNMSEVNPDIVQ